MINQGWAVYLWNPIRFFSTRVGLRNLHLYGHFFAEAGGGGHGPSVLTPGSFPGASMSIMLRKKVPHMWSYQKMSEITCFDGVITSVISIKFYFVIPRTPSSPIKIPKILWFPPQILESPHPRAPPFCHKYFQWFSGRALNIPVDNFGTVVGENPRPYGILALWAVNDNGLSIVYWDGKTITPLPTHQISMISPCKFYLFSILKFNFSVLSWTSNLILLDILVLWLSSDASLCKLTSLRLA